MFRKKWIKIAFIIVLFIGIVLFEAWCPDHGGGFHFHGISDAIFHWFIHLAVCVLVCETVHSLKHGCKEKCKCDHKD